MNTQAPPRHPLALLADEVIRLNSRLKSLFADARRPDGLGDAELTVLNAVVEADRAPTVSQIGRSLGQPRQIIQRAANSLIDAGLIEALPNPDHKRAVLLRPSAEGTARKRAFDMRADALAEAVTGPLDAARIDEAATALRLIRKDLEASLRAYERARDAVEA